MFSEVDHEPKTSSISNDTINELILDLTPGITEDDKLLWRKDKNAVEFSLNYAKLWSKFCKDLVVTMEKKASIENDSNRGLMKLFQGLETTLSSNNMIGAPVRTETINMCKLVAEQCKEVESQNTKKLGKLLDVINRQRTEFSKTRKHYKDKWKADCKKMMDAENTMLKTRSAYYQRCQQGVKLREELTNAQSMLNYMRDHGMSSETANPNAVSSVMGTGGSQTPQSGSSSNFETYGSNATLSNSQSSSNQTDPGQVSASQLSKQKAKVDKLEKLLADNDKKEIEQMYSYKESVETANQRLIEFEKKKLEHLCDIRLTTVRSDEIVKDTLAEFVKILTETRMSMIKEYAVLGEKFQEYKPCQEYKNLIEKQTSSKPDSYAEKFQVELYHDSAIAKEKSESQLSKGLSRFGLGLGKDSDHEPKNRNILASHSDSDSDPEIDLPSTGSIGNAPSSTSNRTGVLNTIVEFGSNFFMKGGNNDGGVGDGSGAVGTVSGSGGGRKSGGVTSTSSTKKSTSGSTSSMGMDSGGEKDSQSSSASAEWMKEVTNACEIVLRCIQAIEAQENGLATHGIYRVSASKSKVATITEALVQQQQGSSNTTDIDQESPITLASAVKSKLISLSEPLVPYGLYTEFVELGKEAESAADCAPIIVRLNGLVHQIPAINKKLLGLIFHHLKKVASNSEENQMGSTNLGTLFAPTLIKTKPRFRNVDIKEYMDNKSQAKIVQLIIENVDRLFGAEQQYYTLTSFTTADASDISKDTLKRDNEEELIASRSSTQLSASRPQSNIIESTDTLSQNASETSAFSRLYSGSLRVPSPSSSYLKPTNDIPDPSLSPRLREKKISSHSLCDEDQQHQQSQATQQHQQQYPLSISGKTSPTPTHRSISFTAGNGLSNQNISASIASTTSNTSSDGFKLAQLSQPSNDSIFSKKLHSDSVAMDKPVGDRSINLKKSFISSSSSTANSSSSTNMSPSTQSSVLRADLKRNSGLKSTGPTTGVNNRSLTSNLTTGVSRSHDNRSSDKSPNRSTSYSQYNHTTSSFSSRSFR